MASGESQRPPFREAVGFGDTACEKGMGNGLFMTVVHIITRTNCQNVPILEELASKTPHQVAHLGIFQG